MGLIGGDNPNLLNGNEYMCSLPNRDFDFTIGFPMTDSRVWSVAVYPISIISG
jgi:hypothetical protein